MSIPPGANLNDIPAGVPPAGVTPNLINPTSLQTPMVTVWSILIGITVPVVFCRCFFNYNNMGKLGPDDWATLLATLFSLCHSGVIMSYSKVTRHQWDIPLAWFNAAYFKKSYTQQIFSCLAIFTSKVSILLLYRRIFQIKRWMNYAIYAGIVWGFIANIPFIALASWYCAPHAGEQWGFSVSARCNDPIKWDVAAGAMGLMLDIYILILPLPSILKLHLSRKKLIGVLLVFLTATFAIVCACLTLVFYVKVMTDTGDASWASSQLLIVRGVENYISILVSCAPGMSSFFKAYIAESKIYTSIANTLLTRRGRSNGTSKRSGNSSDTKSVSHIGLGTIGGTPYKHGKRGLQFESTTQLQGYSEIKDGKVVTDVSHIPTRGDLGEDGIQRSIGFEQSSTHSVV